MAINTGTGPHEFAVQNLVDSCRPLSEAEKGALVIRSMPWYRRLYWYWELKTERPRRWLARRIYAFHEEDW